MPVAELGGERVAPLAARDEPLERAARFELATSRLIAVALPTEL